MTAAAAAEDAAALHSGVDDIVGGPQQQPPRPLIAHKRTVSDQSHSTGGGGSFTHRHYQHYPAVFSSDSDSANGDATTVNNGVKRPLAASRSVSSSQASAVAGWSAISSELKSRQQRVAKVRPQPQQPHNITASTVIGRETEGRSSTKVPKTSKKQSEYAQLSDLFEGQESERNTSVRSWKSAGHSFDMNNSDLSAHRVSDDDAVSVAGTVFNEPWDSNVWENLLDLAQFGDERPTAASARIGASYMHIDDRISEEESSPGCSTESSSSSASTGHHEDSDLAVDVAYSQRCGDAAENASHHALDFENQENIEASIAAPDQENYDVFEDDASHILTVSGNRNWSEISQQIPSQPSTYDSRRGKSNSMMNVGAAGTSDMMMMSGSGKDSLKRRAQTPNVASSAHLTTSIDDLPITIPQLSPVISPPRLRNAHKNSDPGVRIQKYVESLAADETTVFGATLQRFIECTVEAEESDPYVVIRNVRQFLNGIKNYLVKHGEGDLHFLIERESAKLNANEFLNIDAILEAVLHKILLVPVKPHLYHLMVRENSRSGALQSLSENLAQVRSMKLDQLGFPEGTRMPDSRQMEQIRLCLRKMQHHYSPLKKLENLLRALSHVISRPAPVPVGKRHQSAGDLSSAAFGGKSKKLPPADELIRWLVYLLARTSSVGCEVEAWYMWELLPQQLLTTGDAAYYLSTLFSAIHVLKHPDSLRRLKNIPDSVGCMGPQTPKTNGNSEETSDAFIRVAVPDEQAGSIEYHTFPAVSQMNAAKLCRVIAHQFAITNPEDYGLYILFDGFETCLLANECPDVVRDQLSEAGKSYLFAYKRHDAKIAWPKNIVQASAANQPTTPPANQPTSPPHHAVAALAGDHALV